MLTATRWRSLMLLEVALVRAVGALGPRAASRRSRRTCAARASCASTRRSSMLVMTVMLWGLRCGSAWQTRDASACEARRRRKLFQGEPESSAGCSAARVRARSSAARARTTLAASATKAVAAPVSACGSSVVLMRRRRHDSETAARSAPLASQCCARLGRAERDALAADRGLQRHAEVDQLRPLRRLGPVRAPRPETTAPTARAACAAAGAGTGRRVRASAAAAASSAGATTGSTTSCISSAPPASAASPWRTSTSAFAARDVEVRNRQHQLRARSAGCAEVNASRCGTRICRAKVGGALTRSRSCAASCAGAAAPRRASRARRAPAPGIPCRWQ